MLAEADVVVCGGGTAGIAAACCAARHGAKVVLLERWPSLGGMATNALVNIWHTSDRTKQVIFGFVEEADRSGADRSSTAMRDFPKRPGNPLVRSRGNAGRVPEDARRVPRAHLLQPQGGGIDRGGRPHPRRVGRHQDAARKAVLGRIVIDATGDGDVAANAGLPFDFGRPSDGRVQGMTMMLLAFATWTRRRSVRTPRRPPQACWRR